MQLNYDIQDFVPYNLYDYFAGIQNINEFEEWINNVFKNICNKLSEKTSVTDIEYIQAIKKYITDHIEDDICLETVAKNLYISPHYLCKIFKKETNMGFNSFVTQCKMEKAKYYIMNSDKNINEISEKLDYKNTSYFIKMFKETYGKTPKQYRYDLTISNPEICTDK
jgi:YesN/AraC family two-component response regulator